MNRIGKHHVTMHIDKKSNKPTSFTYKGVQYLVKRKGEGQPDISDKLADKLKALYPDVFKYSNNSIIGSAYEELIEEVDSEYGPLCEQSYKVMCELLDALRESKEVES